MVRSSAAHLRREGPVFAPLAHAGSTGPPAAVRPGAAFPGGLLATADLPSRALPRASWGETPEATRLTRRPTGSLRSSGLQGPQRRRTLLHRPQALARTGYPL